MSLTKLWPPKLWPLPVPVKVRTWHKAEKPTEAWILARRLLKFVDTATPPQYVLEGGRWGEGQVHIETREGDVYRGQIAIPKEEEPNRADDRKTSFKTLISKTQNRAPIPLWLLELLPLKYPVLANEYPDPSVDGLSIRIQCAWIAKKNSSTKIGRWNTEIPMWRWELIPLSTSFHFTIARFRQSKTCRWRGVLYPKRLFFETAEGEPGYFSQRDDPENLIQKSEKDDHLTDPLHPTSE